MAGSCKNCGGLTTNTRAKTPLGLCFNCEHGIKDVKEAADDVVVAREDYEEILNTVQQLQTKYNAVLDDKQRWRNFALLSSATQLYALSKCFSPETAVQKANDLLTLIEGDNGTAGAGS